MTKGLERLTGRKRSADADQGNKEADKVREPDNDGADDASGDNADGGDSKAKAAQPKPAAKKKAKKSPAAGNVESLDDARVQRAATEYATEVAELCALAGQAERVAEFIAKGMTVPQVRKTLLDDRAEAAGDDVTSTHNGGRAGGNGGDMWRKVLAKRGVLKEQAKAG